MLMGLAAVLILQAVALFYDRNVLADMTIKPYWAMSQPEDAYDFVVLGSSRAQSNVDIATLEKKWDMRGINLGISDGSPLEQYLIFEFFLRRQKRVKFLFLAVDDDGLTPQAYANVFSFYAYLPLLKDPVAFESVREFAGKRAYAWKYVPFLKYAEFNSKTGLINLFNIITGKKPRRDEKGSYLRDVPFREVPPERFRLRRDLMLQRCFEKILDLARSRNIKVIAFYPPEMAAFRKNRPNWDEMMTFYRLRFKNLGIPFYFFETAGPYSSRDFYFDPRHLNKKGALAFTEELGAAVGREMAG